MMVNVNALFYDPLGNEVGRVNFDLGDSVPIPEGATDFRAFVTTVTLPLPPNEPEQERTGNA